MELDATCRTTAMANTTIERLEYQRQGKYWGCDKLGHVRASAQLSHPIHCHLQSRKKNGLTNRGKTEPEMEGIESIPLHGVFLFFPYERNTEQVQMPAPVGPFFWPSPFWPLDDFFGFFAKFGLYGPKLL